MDAKASRVERLRPGDAGPLAAAGFIYEDAFPPEERKPLRFLAEAVARPDYEVLVLAVGARVVGLAVVYRSNEHRFSLIEYMAVAAEARGNGLGAGLFEAIARRNRGRPLLLEVEAVGEDGEAGSEAGRRQAFYRRLGCREVMDVRYKMPRVASRPPPEMRLFVGGRIGERLPRSVLEAWLHDVFRNVYGIEEPGPMLHKFLADKPRSIPLI